MLIPELLHAPATGRPPAPPPPAPVSRRAPLRGFTAVELVLLLVALGLAGYVAAVEIRQWRHRAYRDEIVADLRQFAGLFQAYRAEKGEWPPATNPEQRLPRGMESVLTPTHWAAGPALGGNYDWTPPSPLSADAPTGRPAAAGMIELTAFSPQPPLPLDEADLRYIDRQLDDGDLATGHFRRGYNGWPVYFVDATR